LLGSLWVIFITILFSFPIGVGAAIYLQEYASDTPLNNLIETNIRNLAGVPSIIYGLLGLAIFVRTLGTITQGRTILSAGLTMALLILPVIIINSQEALRAVPSSIREGSYGLGATKWQTIRKAVFPYALPGILTSSILGIARVAGETAPIMFTAAFVVRDKLPWEDLGSISDFFFQGVMALPYHIYVVSSKIPQNEYTERVQYGTAFVFLLIVALIATSSIVLRSKLRGRYKW